MSAILAEHARVHFQIGTGLMTNARSQRRRKRFVLTGEVERGNDVLADHTLTDTFDYEGLY
jgi:hypothetical protein